MTTVIIIVLVIAAVLVVAGAVAAFVMDRDKKRRQVREDFGPEYHRELARTGDRGKAQKELEERQKRVCLIRPEAAFGRRCSALLRPVAPHPGALRG